MGIQVLSDLVGPVAFLHQQVADIPDNRRLFLVDDKIMHRFVPLVYEGILE